VRNVGNEVPPHFVCAFQFRNVVKQNNRADDVAVVLPHRNRIDLELTIRDHDLALDRLAATESLGNRLFNICVTQRFEERRA
jgi:hypothetical protein